MKKFIIVLIVLTFSLSMSQIKIDASSDGENSYIITEDGEKILLLQEDSQQENVVYEVVDYQAESIVELEGIYDNYPNRRVYDQEGNDITEYVYSLKDFFYQDTENNALAIMSRVFSIEKEITSIQLSDSEVVSPYAIGDVLYQGTRTFHVLNHGYIDITFTVKVNGLTPPTYVDLYLVRYRASPGGNPYALVRDLPWYVYTSDSKLYYRSYIFIGYQVSSTVYIAVEYGYYDIGLSR